MKSLLLLFIISQIISAYSSSSGRYKQKPNFFQRYRRMNKGDDCMYNICEHVSDYPETLVDEIINKHQTLHSYFGGSIIEPSSELFILKRTNKELPRPFCTTLDRSVEPKSMEDINGIKRNIANSKNFKQIVKFQVCNFANGGSCYSGNSEDIKTHCVQKFNVIKLLTVNFENKELEYQKFRIPSTCVCTYNKQNIL